MMITQAFLKEILDYDCNTGVFSWKVNINTSTSFHGKIAGSIAKAGNTSYIKITIGGKGYAAHRLAFLYKNGKFPTHQIDHIFHNGLDNRWKNLREVTPRENILNCRISKSNTSGYKGVSYCAARNQWRAEMKLHGHLKFLGYFKNINDAILSRTNAEEYYKNNPDEVKKFEIKKNNRPKKIKTDLTLWKLKSRLEYSPTTGKFIRLTQGGKYLIGDEAGSVVTMGTNTYIRINVCERSYLAHQLAVFYMTGKFPPKDMVVAHKFGNGIDNSWKNLKVVSQSENLKTCRMLSNNTSGIKGVYYSDNRKNWVSAMQIKGEKIIKKQFDNLFEACCHRKSNELKYGFKTIHI